MFKKIILFPLFFILLVFPACLELGELVKLQTDGRVNFTLRFSIPEIPEKKGVPKSKDDNELEDEIQKMLFAPGRGGLKLINKEEKEITGIKYFGIEILAQTLGDLTKLYKSMTQQNNKASDKDKKDDAGEEAFRQLFQNSPYKVKRTKKGTLQISRSFNPPKLKKTKKSPKKDKDSSDEMGKMLEDKILNTFRIRFEFISPTTVLNSNALHSRGRDLRWETTFGYLLREPFEMKIEIQSTPELDAKYK